MSGWDTFFARQLVHQCVITAASVATAVDADYQRVPEPGAVTSGVACRYVARSDEDIIDSEEAGVFKIDASLYLTMATPVTERARVSSIVDSAGASVDPGVFWVRRILPHRMDATTGYQQCLLERFR